MGGVLNGVISLLSLDTAKRFARIQYCISSFERALKWLRLSANTSQSVRVRGDLRILLVFVGFIGFMPCQCLKGAAQGRYQYSMSDSLVRFTLLSSQPQSSLEQGTLTSLCGALRVLSFSNAAVRWNSLIIRGSQDDCATRRLLGKLTPSHMFLYNMKGRNHFLQP
jgi:hypothetical protein